MVTNEQLTNIKAFANELDELRTRLNESIIKRDKLIIHLSNERMTNAEIARLFNMKHQNVSTVLRKEVLY